jgi:hypothetical protein
MHLGWANEMDYLHCGPELCELSGYGSDGASTMTWSTQSNSDDENTSFGILAIHISGWKGYEIRLSRVWPPSLEARQPNWRCTECNKRREIAPVSILATMKVMGAASSTGD